MNNATSIFCFTDSNFIDFWIFSKKLRITVSFCNYSCSNYYNNDEISLFKTDENDQKFCDDAKEEKSKKELVIFLK